MPRSKAYTVPAKAMTTVGLAVILVSYALAAPNYQVLHAFTGGKDGGGPGGGLVLDTKGNLYGATSGGGDSDQGTVFELMPGSGEWSEDVLHNFPSFSRDGEDPNGGLIFDLEGNLYGTTVGDGGPYKYGTIFELTPRAHAWKETVLHRFGQHDYGADPHAGLLMDGSGNFYGTAPASAFELTSESHGWKEIVLHEFTGQNGDGSDAYAGLIMDTAGNLYGETAMGGTSKGCGGGCGTVYELQPTDGRWKEHILHDFDTGGDDMAYPEGPLLLDKAGNLYGTAGGGTYAHGAVYRLTRHSDGRWRSAILYSFTGGADGDGPGGGVVMDQAGNLYGTSAGGSGCGCGVVYELSPGAKGKWTYTLLHTFSGSDGAGPDANLILDDKGNLYGTTATGGPAGYGVAFELTP